MPKAPAIQSRFRIYLTVLAIIGLVFISIATSKYGAGVSSDAARNLSTADNLIQGKGFVDMIGEPFILWPPLYPLILAGMAFATGWTTFEVAWYLNVVLYALNIWLAGWFLYTMFRDKPLYAAVGSLVLLLSRSMLRIHANVASEPLFETLMLLFFLSTGSYLQNDSRRGLWFMFGLAGLATLQRYLGAVLFGVALVAVFRRGQLRGLRRAILPAVVALLPFAAWIGLHNYAVSGTLFGPRELGAMLPLENIGLALTKMLWWFLPRVAFLDWLILRPWTVLLALAVLLILINRPPDWRIWLRALANEQVWPALLFSGIYFLLLAFTVITADHLDLTSDRYYVVLLPAVVALLLITADRLVISHIQKRTGILGYGLLGAVALWFVYPVYGLQAYLRQALVQGEPTNYNIANSANFREMAIVKAAEPVLDKDPGALVYSNYLNIVWFIFHHPVEALPFEDAALPREQRLLALRQNYPRWPDHKGYLIWFTPNQYHHIVAPDELATIASLHLIYEDKSGQLYYVDGP
jgi:hypothetical protein